MKKFFTFILAITLGINVFAQCPLTEAVDFTATDCHGTEVHLFDILDGGQYVLIDFFYTTCGPCNAACPKVVEAYQLMGCNLHDIFFMEITPYDNNTACQNWCNTYGVEYPTIGTNGGGSTICNNYGITAYPTCIIIAPDHEIIVNDIWPISNAQTITNLCIQHGMQLNDCTSSEEPTVEISGIETTTTTVTATFTPNEECATYYYLLGTQEEMDMWAQMMQTTIEALVMQWGIATTATETYTWTEQTPETEYTIFAVPLDADGNVYEMVTALATTETAGGTGESVIEAEIINITGSSATTVTTPNEETAEYHYGLITCAYYEEIGEEGLLEIIQQDPYPFYETSTWVWSGLEEGTDYFCWTQGKNALGEWGMLTLIQFTTIIDGVEEYNALSINIFPNPATDFVKIEGNNIQTIEIFNIAGQSILKQDVNGSEATISTENLESGVYFVRINDTTTKKLIVK